MSDKEFNHNNGFVNSDGDEPKAVLDAINLIRDVAVGTVAVMSLEESQGTIEMLRGTIEYLVDFNSLHSPHYDVKEAILSSFDKAVAQEDALSNPKDISVE